MNIPSRTTDRLASGIKKYQPVLLSAKTRDINESDTVIIVTDVLADMFGYEKYSEITSEYAIRGTYCDLAIKLDGHPKLLIEVKAIGVELRDSHSKQAVDYAANLGVEWVVLTNGLHWKVYRVNFGQPISQDLVFEFDFSSLDHKSEPQLELIGMLCKEGLKKSMLDGYHEQRQAMSRYFLGAMVLTEPVLEVLRRELRRISPGVRIDLDEMKSALMQEVIKREVLEGEKAEEARRKISRSQGRQLRTRKETGDTDLPSKEQVSSEAVAPMPSAAAPPRPPEPGL